MDEILKSLTTKPDKKKPAKKPSKKQSPPKSGDAKRSGRPPKKEQATGKALTIPGPEPQSPPSEFKEPTDLAGKKMWEEWRDKRIKNEQALGNLIPKPRIKGILAQLGQELKVSFVDMPRRESAIFAATLGIPEKEKELEMFWAKKNEEAINSFLEAVARLQKDEIYE